MQGGPSRMRIAMLALVAILSVEVAVMWMRHPASPTPELNFLSDQEDLRSACYSPNGSLILTSGGGGAATWDSLSGRPVAKLAKDRTLGSAFSPSGDRVLTWTNRGTAFVWEVANGEILSELIGHKHAISHAEFSPDGSWVVTAGRDHTARVWDALTGRQLALMTGHAAELSSATFSPDGAHVLTASSNRVTEYYPDGGGQSSGGGNDSTMRIWNASTGVCLKVFERTPEPVDPETAALLSALGHKTTGSGIGFRGAFYIDEGKRILSWDSNDVCLWDAGTGEEILRLDEGWTIASFIPPAVSPDGSKILGAASTGPLLVWDARSGELIAMLSGHAACPAGVSWSPDGRLIVSSAGYEENHCRVWDAGTGRCLAVLQVAVGEEEKTSAAFSPDGMRLVTSGESGAVAVFAAPKAEGR